MEVSNNLEKIKLVLKNVFDGKVTLSEMYAEKLLQILEDNSENSPGKRILDSHCFSDLIISYTLEKENNYNNSIKAFLVEIITMLIKNRPQCPKIQQAVLRTLIHTFSETANPPPNVHLAGIKLAKTQLTNISGLLLIIGHNVWKKILRPGIHIEKKEVSRVTYDFMAQLVWKLNKYNIEPALQEVLGHITKSILSSGFSYVTVLDVETDTMLSNEILPHVSVLLAVLKEADNYPIPNKVMPTLRNVTTEFAMFKLCSTTKNIELLMSLTYCWIRYFFQMYRPLLYSNQVNDFCIKMTVFHRNYVAGLIRKRYTNFLIDFVIQSCIIWSNFEKNHAADVDFPLTFERNNQINDFSLQLIACLLVPPVKYASHKFTANCLVSTDIIDSYFVKMGKSLTDYIHIACYSFGDILEEGGLHMKRQVLTYTLKEMVRLKGHITESQVGPIFQCLFYILTVYISSDEAELFLDNTTVDAEDLMILSHTLVVMKMILNEYMIPWYENLEIVNIQAALLNLLKQSFLTTKQMVKILDLINICVKKFISPNMSLLVENKGTEACTLNETGKVILKNMQHEDWEVRDSALTLLHSCTQISLIKYIPLQKIIKENGLIVLAAKAALSDPEYYSQCTALKCLTAATNIDTMWQEVITNNENIYFQLVCMLKNHSEGMVRKEVVNVLTKMYVNHKVSIHLRNKLYKVMQTAALDDFEYEVQLAALNFWRRAIHDHLTHRGMIDGNFPSVTFSKEKRKIIFLDHLEIQRQLAGIMDHLSKIGCLTVLLQCVDDSHNVRVMELAYTIAKELIELLYKYKYEKLIDKGEIQEIDVRINYMETEDDIYETVNRCHIISDEERTRVIDSILNTKVAELLINLHDNYEKSKNEVAPGLTYYPDRQLVKPDKFIECFKNNDYSLLIERKKNRTEDYVTSLDELLEDILSSQVNT